MIFHIFFFYVLSGLMSSHAKLMLLGFISFLLNLSQGFIIHICIPETATHFMLPCKKENQRVVEEGDRLCKKVRVYHIFKLMRYKCFYAGNLCCAEMFSRMIIIKNRLALFQGYVPLLSLEALNQLHIFIFVLGLVHVVFYATTILLGVAKVYS